MKTKLKVLLPLLFVIALLAVMSFAVNAKECEHSIVHVEAQEPSCHREGNVEYWYCDICELFWADEDLIWPSNYRLTRIEPTEDVELIFVPQIGPNCEGAGMKEHWYCPECGIIRLDPDGIEITRPFVEIPALEHSIVHIEAQEPSCHSDGNVEYWHCAECDQYWLDEARTQVTQKEATVIYSGLEHEFMDIGNYYICRYCGEENNFDPTPEKWYTKAVIYCVKNGYMTGVSPERFGHNENVTRAMFTTILAKIDGSDLTAYEGKSSFSDVKTDGWYTAAIEWAYQNGYAAGLGDGIFGYKENVTREQLVTFFYTYSAKNGVDVSGRADLAKYSDCDKIHDWARDAMSWAVNVGLVSGTSETTLSPRSFATRAEIALIVKNYVENVKG